MKLLLKSALAAGLLLVAVGTAAVAQDQPAADPYAAVMKRDFGTAIDEMTAIEKEIESAPADRYPAFEDKLIAILNAPDATKPGKQFACQMLRIVGSPKCIPAVAALLTDEQLSHIARYVLLPMKNPAADTALRVALTQTTGPVRIGIVNTLGDRKDREALNAVAALVGSGDELTGRACLNAIGKIGGVPAEVTLERLKPPAPLNEAWALAYLHTAENLIASGDHTHPGKMLRRLLTPENPIAVRAAALDAYALDQKERSVPLIIQNLSSPEGIMRRSAMSAVIAAPGHRATIELSKQLKSVPNDVKPELLEALASRGDAIGVTDTVNKLTADADPVVRKAAVLALGKLGNNSSVALLAPMLKDSDSRRDALQALGQLNGPGVVPAMVQSASTGDPEVRSALLTVLAQRGQIEALPAFRTSLADPDPKIRRAGVAGLSALGALEDMKPLADRMASAADDSEREDLGGAMTAIGLRTQDENARCAAALQALNGAAPATKVALLAVLASLGGDRALQTVQASLAENGDVHNAALRGLAEWPTSAPMAALKAAAKDETDKSNRIVALRGYIKMIGGSPQQPAEKVQSYKDAIAMSERPDEKRQAFAGLAETGAIESLTVIQPFLDDPDVRNEAYLAYERLGEALSGRQPDAAREALQKVIDNAPDGRLKNRARAALGRIR
jgi:HEAT repeat protein